MTNTLSIYEKDPHMPPQPKHRFTELYQIYGMENITVSESEPSSHLMPFLLAMIISGATVWISILLFGLPH